MTQLQINAIRFVIAFAILVLLVQVAQGAEIIPPLHDAGTLDAAPLVSAPTVAAAPSLPDPVAEPLESVSLLVKLWKTGTIPATLIVGLFLVLSFASRKVKALQKGHVAFGIAVAMGGLAILLEPASRGTTPTLPMVMTALVAAGAILVKGKPEQPATP